MLFRLVRSVKRSDSSHLQFVQRIPADLIARAANLKLSIPLGDGEYHHLTISPKAVAVRFSLRTRDPSLAKTRHAHAAAYLESVWRSLRAAEPVTLSHRQATALAGELYRAWRDEGERSRTVAVIYTPEGFVPVQADQEEIADGFDAMAARLAGWRAEAANHEDAPTAGLGRSGEASDLEGILGPLVTRLLLRRGIAEVDSPSRLLLLEAFALALCDAFENRARNARGDYSPDPKSVRFPEWRAPEAPEAPRTAGGSLAGLVEDWWSEASAAGRKASTYESYRNTMRRFVRHLGHDDASRVAAADVLAFKDARLKEAIKPGRTVSAQTVNGSDLAGLKTIFAWAVSNQRMVSNPAAGITIKVGKKRRLRSKGFSDEEAIAILKAASATTVPPWRSGAKHQAAGMYQARAQRWVPWLCCYTGARVGEMAQLRKQDVQRVGEHWVARITPEAGTVKTDEARDVVLHPHLVEMGFVAFVEDCADGYLFLNPAADGNVRGRWRGLKNRLAEFAREIVPDPEVAPNHGWRHRFKTVAREVGIEGRVVDAIQGHAPKDVSDSYGDVTVKAQAVAIARFPRVEVA